jgi:hypothetical protein
MRELSQSAHAPLAVGGSVLKSDVATPKSGNHPWAAHCRHGGSGMTLNERYRRQTWLINLLILMLLVVGGLGLYGLAESQSALDSIYARRVVAMAQLAPGSGSGSATLSAHVQQQADLARKDIAEAARLHGRLRAAILLTIVLGIGGAAAYGSGLPRHPVLPEAPGAKDTPPVVAAELLPAEPAAGAVSEGPADWDGSNRRGPNRARNVARISKKPGPDSSATRDDRREATDDWEPF